MVISDQKIRNDRRWVNVARAQPQAGGIATWVENGV